MADPISNWCTNVAGTNLKMFSDTPNDLTIESAVIGTSTIAPSSPADFDDLKSKAYNAYRDTNFLSSGAFNETDHFRGYPKPTVTATFSEYSSTSDTNNSLRVTCTIPNKVGFDVITVFQNLDVDSTAYEATIPSGSLTSGLSPLFATTDAGSSPIDYTITYLTTGSTNQYTPTLAGDTTGQLVYTEPILREGSLSIDYINNPLGNVIKVGIAASDSCSASHSDPSSSEYFQSKIWATTSPVELGDTLYKGNKASNGGNTIAASKVFFVANLGLGYSKIVTNSSGVITSFTVCTPTPPTYGSIYGTDLYTNQAKDHWIQETTSIFHKIDRNASEATIWSPTSNKTNRKLNDGASSYALIVGSDLLLVSIYRRPKGETWTSWGQSVDSWRSYVTNTDTFDFTITTYDYLVKLENSP